MANGRVFKRGAVWWIQYNVNGRQYRDSAKTTRKEDAQALLRDTLQRIWEGRFFPESRQRTSQKTIGELRDEFIKAKATKRSLDTDESRFGAFVEYVGQHRQLTAITDEVVIAFLDSLTKHTEATKNRYKALLRTAFNMATKRGWANRNPMLAIEQTPEDNTRNRLCSPEEYERLREGAQSEKFGDLRAFITIGYWLGMREGEIAKLDSGRVNAKLREFRLNAEDTKERDVKTLPIPKAVLAELAALPARIDGQVFMWTANTYCRKFATLCDDLRIDDLRFHDLRHTALTRMGEAGLSAKEMAAISGHKTFTMLQRYVHVTPAALKSAMEKLESYAERQSAVAVAK